VAWCNRHISSKFPNFRFQVANLKNSLYTKADLLDASSYRFPYDNQQFNFVLLTSVFTHLLEAEVENYIGEIARLLIPGGRCFFTIFINPTDNADRRVVNQGFQFPYSGGENSWIMDQKTPHANVIFDQIWLESTLAKHQLACTVLQLGYWHSGEPKAGNEFQDIVVVTRIA
jgi:SAM-dependent methyltransferase